MAIKYIGPWGADIFFCNEVLPESADLYRTVQNKHKQVWPGAEFEIQRVDQSRKLSALIMANGIVNVSEILTVDWLPERFQFLYNIDDIKGPNPRVTSVKFEVLSSVLTEALQMKVPLRLPSQLLGDVFENFKLHSSKSTYYALGNDMFSVSGADLARPATDLHLLLQAASRKEKAKLDRLRNFVAADCNLDTDVRRRKSIADDVRIFVWRRDGGKCTQCHSQDRLEYDHIIPFSLGGSDTERNIQLLCESCNRSKSDRI